MINLSPYYTKFKNDISGDTTNIHPVLVIHSEPKIYLSQNEEDMDVQGVSTRFKSLNINIPSIKESIDLKSRKLKKH